MVLNRGPRVTKEVKRLPVIYSNIDRSIIELQFVAMIREV